MDQHTQILRFQEGARSPHPSSEIVVAGPTPHQAVTAGEPLVIMVDLLPPLPRRSREIRALAAQTYQTSSGSVVARLRRALAEANRHLVHINLGAAPGAKCAGSLTCAVFTADELFLGQIGAGYAFVQHPDGQFETFPRRTRLLMPLGGALPPVINIGYTTLAENCVVLLATTPLAEAQARERWQELLASTPPESLATRITATLAPSGASGSLALVQLLPEPAPTTLPVTPRRFLGWLANSIKTPIPPAPLADEPDLPEAALIPTSKDEVPIQEPEPTAPLPEFLQRRRSPQPAPLAAEPAPAPKKLSLPALHLPPLRDWGRALFRQRPRTRATTAERARLHHALRALLPGPMEPAASLKVRPAPQENVPVLGGLVLGVFLMVLFITLTEYWQRGGATRAASLLETAQTARQVAYASQETADWQRLLELSNQIVTLDPRNPEALRLKQEARQAIAALENAATLDARLLLDLGVAPTTRRLLATGRWLYVLDTANGEVLGLELQADALTPVNGTPLTILKYGQTFYGEAVSRLVDMAWLTPGGAYPDGALLIYSDGGLVYIYEPVSGPEGITRQRIQGNLQPGMVTLMKTFEDKFYLVQRQDNQLLTYEPINGIYELPRGYFPPEAAPPLREVVDMGVDGRVYLLMGDGAVRTYFAGTEDLTFKIGRLPDPQFKPGVLAVEPGLDEGLLYLGDAQRQRVAVLDKRGNVMHQFRLPGEELLRLEALAVNETPHVLYLIAENRLLAAPLPDFVAH